MHLDVEESGLGKMFGNAMSGANFEISDKQMKHDVANNLRSQAT